MKGPGRWSGMWYGGHSADVHVIYPKLKTYCYTRPLFNHQCNNSMIHQDHVKRLHEPSLITIFFEFLINIFYQ